VCQEPGRHVFVTGEERLFIGRPAVAKPRGVHMDAMRDEQLHPFEMTVLRRRPQLFDQERGRAGAEVQARQPRAAFLPA
jgi:hypothetical protein